MFYHCKTFTRATQEPRAAHIKQTYFPYFTHSVGISICLHEGRKSRLTHGLHARRLQINASMTKRPHPHTIFEEHFHDTKFASIRPPSRSYFPYQLGSQPRYNAQRPREYENLHEHRKPLTSQEARDHKSMPVVDRFGARNYGSSFTHSPASATPTMVDTATVQTPRDDR